MAYDKAGASCYTTIDKQIAFNDGYGASKPLRDIEAFAMYRHAEGMKSA